MNSDLNHVAIIMDGNTRWAAKRDLPSKMGHKEGVKKAREAVEFSLENNIPYLTLFAFSTENWLRDEIEVKDLISIFSKNNIKPIECLNKKLDPNLHQAMMEIEDDEKEPGTIIQEIQKGFTIKERLLRPSLVGVSKKKENKEKKHEENTEN